MSEFPYVPRLRTALVLTGTGTAGAYHAGVLQALHETGVKLDLVAGLGIGVAGALFAAVDGGAHLWGPHGLWRGSGAGRFYPFRPALRVAAWCLGAALALLLSPLVVLLAAVVAYLVGLLVTLAGFEAAGGTVTSWFRELLDLLFAPRALPTVVPRLVALAVIGALGALAVGALTRGRAPRRAAGALWWRLVGAPLTARPVVVRATRALWHLIRGAASLAQPGLQETSRRYAELLVENLGQPGFRELLVTAHDLDARRDLVFAVLAEPYHAPFFARRGGGVPPRAAEAFDIIGVARDHVMDVLAGALCLPVATNAYPTTFPAEGYWRGETHRLCARPEALGRLLLEIASAGAEQVVVVSDAPGVGGPHGLQSSPSDIRGRAGEYLRAADTAALDSTLAATAHLFRGVFVIRPPHNPVGPFDFRGAYDEQSDRRHGLAELVDRGYEDAYRQFIDPIVGASGERLAVPGARRRGSV